MTPKQTTLYWREWGTLSRRCKAEGWRLPDRHELHVRAIGRDKSSKEFSNGEFDKVLGVFRSYSQTENLNAQVRQDRQPRARLVHRIQIEQMKLLSVVLSTTLKPAFAMYAERPELAGAEAYEPDLEAAYRFVSPLMIERFGTEDVTLIRDEVQPRFLKRKGKIVEKDGQPVVTCEKSDLELLRDTLDARINTKRNERGGGDHGWSIHDVHQAAAVPCPNWCSRCYPRKRGVKVPMEVAA